MFKSIQDSIKLFNEGVEPDTNFEYVFNCEETSFQDFDTKGDIEAQLSELDMMDIQVVEKGRRPYDEFTVTITPAYKIVEQ